MSRIWTPSQGDSGLVETADSLIVKVVPDRKPEPEAASTALEAPFFPNRQQRRAMLRQMLAAQRRQRRRNHTINGHHHAIKRRLGFLSEALERAV